MVRRPWKWRSSTSAINTPASPSNRTSAPGFNFCPGCIRACATRELPAPSFQLPACRVPGELSSRHSTAPPLGTRRPSRRAANTRVLLTTSRSPARSSAGRSPMPPCRRAPVTRSSTMSREAPRGAASCAISSSGRSNAKSETFMNNSQFAIPLSVYNRDCRYLMSEEEPRHVLPSNAAEAAAPPETGEAPAPVVVRTAVDIRSAALTVIAVLAVILVLQYAQAVLIPIVLGVLISYGLAPLVAVTPARPYPARGRRRRRGCRSLSARSGSACIP